MGEVAQGNSIVTDVQYVMQVNRMIFGFHPIGFTFHGIAPCGLASSC